MPKLIAALTLVAFLAVAVAITVAVDAAAQAKDLDARTARIEESEYIVHTYKLIDSLMRDAENIRDFTIDGEGRSCIVTLIDSDFKTIERQGPRWTWHKLVHEVVDEWREAKAKP